jgi:hypothetical protein
VSLYFNEREGVAMRATLAKIRRARAIMKKRGVGKAGRWAALFLLAISGGAHAQILIPDSQTPEASAASTIMLDPVYLASLVPTEAYVDEPLAGPAGGLRTNLPGTFLSYSVARVEADGGLMTRCFAPGELRSPLDSYLEGEDSAHGVEP